MTPVLEIGPLLRDVLAAQEREDAHLRYPAIEGFADSLISLCVRLEYPLIWPVSVGAERLAGASILRSAGSVSVRELSHESLPTRVLLLILEATTPGALFEAARQARRMGATEVFSCGINVGGSTEGRHLEGIDGHWVLTEVGSAHIRCA